ncbi:FHA domain-containing protein [Actinomadura meyerae]|uniref:FHA domain-containing protein n=1 Tax=Actinomadura meyerae TaxID=240840 RepID=A0A239DXE3_9ACTN|nr:FHA domain-containing protein [Actinomadura meyerae]SNS37166.1 FHA domain-containing protein [Actinomadura meyerae]
MPSCPSGHPSQAEDYCDVCGERIGDGSSAPGAAAASAAGAAGAAAAGAVPGPPAGGTPCPDCGTPSIDRFCETCGYDFATGGGLPTPRTAPAQPSQPSQPAQSVPPVQPAQPGPPTEPFTPPPAPPHRGPSEPPPAPQPPSPPSPPVPVPPVPAPSAQQPPVSGAAWTAVVTADREYFNTVIAEEGPDSASLSFPPYAPERRIPLTRREVRIGRRSSSRRSQPEIDLREPPGDPGVSHVHAVLLAKPDGTWTLVDPGSTNRTCVNGSTEPIPYNVEVPVKDGDRIHVGAWTTITLIRGEAT